MTEITGVKTVKTATADSKRKAVNKNEKNTKIDTTDGYKGTVEEKPDKPIAGWKRAILNATDKVSATVGTLAGLAGGTAGLYVGAAGGALLAGAIGLGLGPAVAAVTAGGFLSGIGTTFATAGLAGKIGIVAGSLTTGYGMFKMAKKAVDVIDAVPRKLFGAAEKTEKEEGPPKKSGAVEGLVAAVGAGSGVVGGAVAGAGVAAAGATIEGLLATGVTMAAVTGAGAVGAGVGAALFGLGGFVGSWSLIGKAKKGIKAVMKKWKKNNGTEVAKNVAAKGANGLIDKFKKSGVDAKILAASIAATAVGFTVGPQILAGIGVISGFFSGMAYIGRKMNE